ncbi:MAG: MATE family efflux transporter [Oscillospiraceae bacterium]|nr:MATE family efflux transporter [Oscillospiraceae bacterium]
MTEGSAIMQIIGFSLPLMLGNVFQMLYNTVDSIVVGNFVGSEALAAVGSTTMIANMLVFFFNGFATGAGVVIAHHFGAHDEKYLHKAIETTMAVTFICSVLFTFLGMATVRLMLRWMATPENVLDDATVYLRIYFLGFAGLLIYNMGSGILRAVGDTRRPLYFLILTSVLNIILDLVFVLGLKAGIAGVAYATIVSQFVSAILVIRLLVKTSDVYRFSFREMRIDRQILQRIFMIGMPAGIQSVITAFSNMFVQAYINFFGSDCMAGWGCYNKLDQFIMLPMQSMAMAATTFVSQNLGAGRKDRAEQGTKLTVLMSLAVTAVIAALLFVFADEALMLFSSDEPVIAFGVMFLRTNVFFMLANCINHVLAGSLRGRGDAAGPMIIMISCFVVLRQIYLFVLTHFISNTPMLVGFGYPVGWMACCVVELTYFYFRWGRGQKLLENRRAARQV